MRRRRDASLGKGGDAGAAFEFLIDALDGVAGAHALVMGGGKGVNGEVLREGLLHRAASLGAELEH
jgi:hypothetical protein